VNDNLRQFVFGLTVLILGAAAEELLPKFLGVGFPVLLTAVQALAAVGGSLPIVVLLAIVAGALEDALSCLPMLASVSYFLLVALLVRGFGLPRLSALLTYPCYQLWLALWTVGSDGSVFVRLLFSLPIGGLTALVVVAVVVWASRKGAVNEQD